MKRLAVAVLSACALLLPLLSAAGPKEPEKAPWEFLSTTTIGARAFLEAHPQWDGRGVLIAVCDSGVDLDLPGLRTTTDGKTKILDARDFTDETKTALEEAQTGTDEHGEALRAGDGKWLYGLGKLGIKREAGSKLYVGYFKEESLKNSSVPDLNNNGSATDVFGLVVLKDDAGAWLAVLDTDADGDLSDEEAAPEFRQSGKVLALGGRDLHDRASLLKVAVNLWPEQKEAALFFADNSHGTHVSGIASGHEIDGKPGYDGIAPGAQLLALKLGSGTLSGGATTPGSMVSSWRYAIERAEALGLPLVLQMSYGVGSEDEGRGEAEKLLDELLADHPGVAMTISAGNEGPGLSTVGMPACSTEALAVGAGLAKTTARDLYGAALAQDELFSFSSRGGEVAKPDIVCPGFAASTVPVWAEGHNVMRGTSMAAPQAAGACALLYSAAKASGLPIRRDWLNAALRRGATPLTGYGPAEQGPGMVDVGRAWVVYQALAKRPASAPAAWTVETESPEMKGQKGPAAFWRGDYFPRDGRRQEVAVRPRFPKEASADSRANFQQAFDLSCAAGWVRVDNGSVFAKADSPAKFSLVYDGRALAAPGLYMTEVRAYDKTLSSADRDRLGPEWTVPVTVVVPERLDAGSAASRTFSVKPAKVQRLFLRASAETAGLALRVEITGGDRGAAAVSLYDPEGRECGYAVLRPDRKRADLAVSSGDLERGVYELDLYGNYLNPDAVDVKADVRALPVAGLPPGHPVTMTLAAGKPASAEVSLTSGLPFTFEGRGSGEISGLAVSKTQKLKKAEWSRTFSLGPGESSAEFELEMSSADFAKFTDVAILITDSDGKSSVNEGMSYRRARIAFEPPEGSKPGEKFTLQVKGGTADPDGTPSWTLSVREVHRFAVPVGLKVTKGKSDEVVLYPDKATALTLTAKDALPALPEGAAWVGKVTLTDRERETLKLVLDLTLRPSANEN